MPIYNKKRKVKVKCKSCGKEFTYEKGGYGDCPRSLEELRGFARDAKRALEGIKCPYCGSIDLENIG